MALKPKLMASTKAPAVAAGPSAEQAKYINEAGRRLLPTEVAAERMGLSKRTLERYRITGDGPIYTRVGLRRVAYRESDIDAWLAGKTFSHYSQELASEVA